MWRSMKDENIEDKWIKQIIKKGVVKYACFQINLSLLFFIFHTYICLTLR
jgi:hypothetical protein